MKKLCCLSRPADVGEWSPFLKKQKEHSIMTNEISMTRLIELGYDCSETMHAKR